MSSGTDVDDDAERILRTYDRITVVGASGAQHKPAHFVPAHMRAHGWRVVAVNPRGGTLFGERVFGTLAEVAAAGLPVGLVDVFRPSEQTPDIARQAVAAGAGALWLQLGIVSAEARAIATAAGLLYVENRCLSVEQRRTGLDAPTR